ncbi:MAG: ABC transporter permease [Dehalococcoidia bacterium]
MRNLLAERERSSLLTVGGRPFRAHHRVKQALLAVMPPVLALLVAVFAWRAWIGAAHVPSYLVPAPEAVAQRLIDDPVFYLNQSRVTLEEALLGLLLGGGAGLLLAVVLAHSRPLERSLLPLAIAIKVTPIIAVAPLLTIWFGFGIMPKVLIAALITFFPILINAIVGFRTANPTTLDLLQSLAASRAQIFFTLRLPASLPYLFSALKISITLALIGALVGEWNGASEGLGQVILLAHNNLDMPTLFAAILVLVILGVLLTQSVGLLERRFLRWHDAYHAD